MKTFINFANLAEIKVALRGGFPAGSRNRFLRTRPG